MYVFAILMLMTTAPAFAQDTAVDVDSFFGEFRPYLMEVAGILVAAAVAYAINLVRQWTGIQIEAKHREALQSALTNGATTMLGKIVPDKTGIKIEIGNQPIADGVEYVMKSVPDAIKYFGLTPERIRAMLEPKLIEEAGDKTSTLGEVTDTAAVKPAAKK